ncbi:hypothetical protein ACS0TY_025878 [Phlomoides rotata]
MKAFGFLCLLVLIGAAMYLGYSSRGSISTKSGVVPIGSNTRALILKNRKLKDNTPDEDDVGHVNLEDYRPIDPVPSSKARIRPGPVQHGTPLMPFIPKPSPPPGKPKHRG